MHAAEQIAVLLERVPVPFDEPWHHALIRRIHDRRPCRPRRLMRLDRDNPVPIDDDVDIGTCGLVHAVNQLSGTHDEAGDRDLPVPGQIQRDVTGRTAGQRHELQVIGRDVEQVAGAAS